MTTDPEPRGESRPESDGAPVHPADKPIEPEHPMMLDGAVVPGDVVLMIRCMLEELLQLGTPPDRLRDMTHDPMYQALYAARQALGEARMNAILDDTINRMGRHHHRDVVHGGTIQPAALTISATEPAKARAGE